MQKKKKKKRLKTNTLALTLNNHLETIIKINNMIKKIMLASLLLPLCLNAQSVGINTEHPNESAALHINGSQHGEEAVLKATLSGSQVGSIKVLKAGKGYSIEDEIFIGGGGASLYAENNRATATIAKVDKNGGIVEVNITNRGSGYNNVPIVSIFRKKDNLGFVLPRVNLTNVKDTENPINITDDNADGLWVYNDKENNNTQTTYWYDKEMSQWHEGIPSHKTPKFAIFSFTGNETINNMLSMGDYGRIFQGSTPLFKEAISNLQGIDIHKDHPSLGDYYYITLPKVPATYLIELNLNINTSPNANDYGYNESNKCTNRSNCSWTITQEGHNLMGYFAQINYNRNTNGNPVEFFRKEITTLEKVGNQHKITWLFTVKVEPDYDKKDTANFVYPFLRFFLGRNRHSTHNLPVEIQKEGSFVKIQQLY